MGTSTVSLTLLAALSFGAFGSPEPAAAQETDIVGTELEIEIKAEWKKNRLEVETKASGGAKLKENYEIDEDTGELRVTLDFSNARLDQRIKIKQIYERRGEG